VVIWNMAPVLREEDEKNENIPKLLCQMDNHLGITCLSLNIKISEVLVNKKKIVDFYSLDP